MPFALLVDSGDPTLSTSPDLSFAGAQWLEDLQQQALLGAQTIGFPDSSRDEDWRRTQVSYLERTPLVRPHDATAMVHDATHTTWGTPEEATFLTHGTAHTHPGMIIDTIMHASHKETALRQALESCVNMDKFFSLLALSRMTSGQYIHVTTSASTHETLVVQHSGSSDGSAHMPVTVIVCDPDTDITIIESFGDPIRSTEYADDPLFVGGLTIAIVGERARLHHGIFQRWSSETTHISQHQFRLGTDAHLNLFGLTAGAKLHKSFWDVALNGAGSDAVMTGIALGADNQHLDHQTLQLHQGPSTTSDAHLKVAVRDSAHSVYSGLIEVQPEAIKANGYVQNRNLLLSPGARADSVPRLEIHANDVKCGHGTTAGHVSEDERFYLQSRGIPDTIANELIVRGFLTNVLNRTSSPAIRSVATTAIDTLFGLAEPEDRE